MFLFGKNISQIFFFLQINTTARTLKKMSVFHNNFKTFKTI